MDQTGWAELPRRHDLAPRSWKLPTGEIVGEAVNHEAIDLLKRDPDEYFRRTRTAPRPPPPPIEWETRVPEPQTLWQAAKEVIRLVVRGH